MENRISDIAVAYCNRGWSILPVKPEEKRPFMQNWLQYTRQQADVKTVENWFLHLAGAGIGIVTGKVSNLIVLDVEHYCPEPIESLLRKYPTDLISRTGSGGYHLFYQYPRNMGHVANRVKLMDGVDLRADGGFIVLPPTRHPNGNCYQWVKEGVPGAFPVSLLDLKSESGIDGDKWMSELLHGVSEGGRNDACARLAGYFFKKGVNADIVESLLTEWNEKNDPPLPAHEITTTIRSIQRRHTDVQTTTSVDYTDDRDKGPIQNKNTFDLMKFGDYIKGYGGEGVTWTVDKWLPDKSITFLVSPPESYKTWLLFDLAVSIASGLNFLGNYRTNKKGPVIIIQQEDSHTGITERLSLIAMARMGVLPNKDNDEITVPDVPDLPIYVHPSRMLRFDKPDVLAELEDQIREIKPVAVMIDPLYSTTADTDGYMAQLAEQMMILKTWRDKYGCSFVIAHHSRKNVDPDSTAREDSWGSQFLNAFLEAGWQIRHNSKLPQNEIVVRRHSKVLGNQDPISLTFDISTVYPMKYTVTAREYQMSNSQEPGGRIKATPAKDDIYAMLSGCGGMSQQDIVTKTGRSRSTISRQLRQLELSGAIEKLANGKYTAKE